jgi:hypothetical protein
VRGVCARRDPEPAALITVIRRAVPARRRFRGERGCWLRACVPGTPAYPAQPPMPAVSLRAASRAPAVHWCPARTPRLPSADPVGRARPRPEAMWRWDSEHPMSVARDQLPAPLVHRPVMAMAQEHQVLKGGRPAVAPVDDVVGVGPRRWPIAPRPHAALVADPERGPGRPRGDPERPSHVDHRRVRADTSSSSASRSRPQPCSASPATRASGGCCSMPWRSRIRRSPSSNGVSSTGVVRNCPMAARRLSSGSSLPSPSHIPVV